LCFDPFLLKYLKLLEMAIVHVLGSMKDEHYFLSLAFQKKQAPRYFNPHLLLVAGMHS
jgi:hypothetical protein